MGMSEGRQEEVRRMSLSGILKKAIFVNEAKAREMEESVPVPIKLSTTASAEDCAEIRDELVRQKIPWLVLDLDDMYIIRIEKLRLLLQSQSIEFSPKESRKKLVKAYLTALRKAILDCEEKEFPRVFDTCLLKASKRDELLPYFKEGISKRVPVTALTEWTHEEDQQLTSLLDTVFQRLTVINANFLKWKEAHKEALSSLTHAKRDEVDDGIWDLVALRMAGGRPARAYKNRWIRLQRSALLDK